MRSAISRDLTSNAERLKHEIKRCASPLSGHDSARSDTPESTSPQSCQPPHGLPPIAACSSSPIRSEPSRTQATFCQHCEQRRRSYVSTYHVSPQVIFLVKLEPFQVFEDVCTGILDIPLRHDLRLLQLANRFPRLANGVSACPFWIDVNNALNGVADGTENLVCDRVAARKLLMRRDAGTPLWQSLTSRGR
ncbi:hypothetical protein LIA77_04262 [Sarocladium implicatum]|nr:hypothetical protein LIA77_04262 [Sarocladium implicatum]